MKSLLFIVFCVCSVSSYSFIPIQYHIQTDKGPDRYFRYQTYNGQFRKEKRLDDGSVVGTYGWVDATGLLRLYDYFADDNGYRVVRTRYIQTEEPISYPTSGQKTPIRRPVHEQTPVFGEKTKTRAKPKVQVIRKPIRKKISPNLRPIFVRNKPKVDKVSPLATKGTPFGSKVSSSRPLRTEHRDKGPPAGFGLDDRPGGQITMNYDIGNQYRKEKRYTDGFVVGEHGYVDPLGILRKTYYRSGTGGLEEVKKSYWVGTRSAGS